MTQLLRDRPAEAIADDGDPGWIDHGILPQRIETGLRARPRMSTRSLLYLAVSICISGISFGSTPLPKISAAKTM